MLLFAARLDWAANQQTDLLGGNINNPSGWQNWQGIIGRFLKKTGLLPGWSNYLLNMTNHCLTWRYSGVLIAWGHLHQTYGSLPWIFGNCLYHCFAWRSQPKWNLFGIRT
jgi:hypothetical protein